MNTELKNQKIWGLVGLGWLGSALAEELTFTKQKTWGTHRDSFDFKKDLFPGNYCDVLFLNTPPVIDLLPNEYANKVSIYPQSKIIFTSSISVYGKNTIEANESSPTQPQTESAIWLCEVEKLLLKKFKERILILRLGGLIGKNRHPINSLSGKTDVVGGDDKINLVHLTDLICIIILLEKICTQPIVNVVTPFHPTKSDYYNEWARKLKIPPASFIKNENQKKEIESQYLQSYYSQWQVPKLDRL